MSSLSQVSSELESMRSLPIHDGVEFPIAARSLLYSLEGNQHCVDCGAAHPQWASVSFGTLLCLQCSGQHRSLGVATSFVRSIDMDTWSHSQLLKMLEGGNAQLQQFLERHRMGNNAPRQVRSKRYHTKAAKFYRIHLAKHVDEVADAGVYQGREVARQKCRRQQTPSEELCPSPSSPAAPRARRRSAVAVQ